MPPSEREVWRSPAKPWHACTPAQRAMLEALWQVGDISWKLTPSQQAVLRKIEQWEKREDRGRVFCLDSSRRWGKSALLITRRVGKAMRHKGQRYVYIAPTHEQVRRIVVPLFAMVLQDCPPGMMPEWSKSEGTYTFKNGTTIELVGLDVRPDGARGTGVDGIDLDEAAFFDNLEYLVNSVLFPQMLGRPHATIVAASTPPTTPAHYWSETMVPQSINEGAHDIKVLDDADQYSKEEIEEFYARMPGGRHGVTARREYRAEHIADDSLTVFPEYKDVEKDIVKAIEPPAWRDCYVALDPGFHDLSAVLFGYWHFELGTLVIEDELAAPRLNSWELAQQIKKKERELWTGLKRRAGSGYQALKEQPYLRVSDNDPRLLFDLQNEHSLTFVATQKDRLTQQVDAVRVALQQHKILIHPRCDKLQKSLRQGVWKKQNLWKDTGRQFGREGAFGHFDLLSALVYLWRNINKRRNPAPALEKVVMGDLRIQDARVPDRPKSRWGREGNRYFVRTGKV